MEANQVKNEQEVSMVVEHVSEVAEMQTLRELSALELSLVGGGLGAVYFS